MKIRGNTVGTNIKPERVLEKAGVTPELAEQVANNTESIGNIETALDAILAIQNELIGGYDE